MDEIGKRATGQLGEYATAQNADSRSTGEIMRDIIEHAQEIIRSEIKLAKVETREEMRKAVQAGMAGATSGVLALTGFLFLCLAAMFALAIVIPLWASALCIGVGLFIVSAPLAMVGRERWKAIRKPERTIGEMKENVEWLKHPTRS